jgi:Helix-turn-helix domain
MRTLDLREAADFLRMSPAVLRQKAREGLVKAAKPGKRWVFLDDDLAVFLRELYARRRQAPLSGSNVEESTWGYQDAVMSGGSSSPRRTANEYVSLLGLATNGRRKNILTG